MARQRSAASTHQRPFLSQHEASYGVAMVRQPLCIRVIGLDPYAGGKNLLARSIPIHPRKSVCIARPLHSPIVGPILTIVMVIFVWRYGYSSGTYVDGREQMMRCTLVILLTLLAAVIGAEAKAASSCSTQGPQACGDGCSITCKEGETAHCHPGQLVNPFSPASGCRPYTKCTCDGARR
jgi:hypothetical protein